MTILTIILALTTAALTIYAIRSASKLAAAQRVASIERERAAMFKVRIEELKLQSENDTEKFRTLASDIVSVQTERLNRINEARLSDILRPLSENIRDFRKAVSDSYSSEARERFALDARIRDLIEANKHAGQEVRDLVSALKGNNKAQGDWGEMLLESILEKSGLRKNEEYFVQVTASSDGTPLRSVDGRLLRPDVVVNYPDGRAVVIDSKVSLTAFMDLANADNDMEIHNAAGRHVESVKRHIDELAAKNYQNYVGQRRTDFVLMFIPNEAAYMAALQYDPALWERGRCKGVLIVSPTLIVSALRLIEQMWQHDRQVRNAVEIAEAAGRMYDKLAAFADDLA